MARVIPKFQYQRRDATTVKERSNQRGGDFDSCYKEGIKIWKPKEGKNRFRILPPTWPNADHYAYDLYINYGIGIDNQAYLSLSKMKKERDPLEEARKLAEREGNEEISKKLNPTKRPAFFLIDRAAEDEGVQLWPAPWTVDKAMCNLAIDEDTKEVIMVDDPDEGCDIIMYKEGTGMLTKYPADKMRICKPTPLSEDAEQADEWLAYVTENSIPKCLQFYSYEHIAMVFEGQAAKTDKPNEDEDATPQRAMGRSTSKPKPSPLPDDDEVDQETGEVTPRKNGNGNGAPKPRQHVAHRGSDPQDEPEESSTMSVASIRERLQGRRRVAEE